MSFGEVGFVERNSPPMDNMAAGEELTCDYWAFDAEAREKLG